MRQSIIKRVATAISERTATARRTFFPLRTNCLAICAPEAPCWSGIEIGGPSHFFSRGGFVPLYPVMGSLDNINFSARTIWAKQSESSPYIIGNHREPGRQLIREATQLSGIEDNRYDVVLASHVLEHLANPIRALLEWRRITTEGGVFVIVVPHKDGTFDHRRPVTSLDHLICDNEAGTEETDRTHIAEILGLHDLSRDPGGGNFEKFRARCDQNSQYRSLHHHVFDTRLAMSLLEHVDLDILGLDLLPPCHIAITARKRQSENSEKCGLTASQKQSILYDSPFPSDRMKAT